MPHARNLLASVLRDRSGNVLPIATIGMLVAAAFVGSAIDLSRDYKVRNQLQSACDAGVLAGRRTVSTEGFDTASQNAAHAYFNTNFDDAMQETRETTFTPSSDDEGKTVHGVATTTLDTLIMRIFDRDQFLIRVDCSSSMGVGNADVMMVLDTTGSMGSALGTTTRIEALKAAMTNFYGTLQSATANTNARIRYGFVPYSTTVNVGRLIAGVDPRYLADAATYQSREPQYVMTQSGYQTTPASTGSTVSYSAVTAGTFTKGNTAYNNNNLCTAALPASQANFTDYGSASTGAATTTYSNNQKVVTQVVSQPQRKYTYQCQVSGNKYYIYTKYDSQTKYTTNTSNYDPHYVQTFSSWLYKPMSWSTSRYKTFAAVATTNGSSGASASYTWAGCIHERRSTAAAAFAYDPTLARITPTTALDVDLDNAPDVNDDATKWAPLWPEITYRRFTDSTLGTRSLDPTAFGSRATSYCPAAAQQLAEMDQDSFATYASSLVATGNTYLDVGMIWGGRLLSPQGIFQDTVNEEPANGGEVSRHIIFMTDGFMEPNIDSNVAWGIEWYDRKVTADGSTSDAARHTQRFLAVCQAIKDKGIRVWVIAFTSALSNDLRTCASDNSSYTASNASGLNTAFQEIAKQVGELRITS